MRDRTRPDTPVRPNFLPDLEMSESWRAVVSLHGDADPSDGFGYFDVLDPDADPLEATRRDDHVA